MPRKTSTTMRVGVMGSGVVTEKKLTASLRDFIGNQSADELTFVVPMLKEEWNDNLAAVVDYFIENDVDYEVMVEAGATKTRALKPYLNNAAEVIERQRGLLQGLIRRIAEGDQKAFLALYSDEDKTLAATLEKALEAGITVLDLADGLAELGSEDDGEDEDEPSEAPEADEEDAEDEPEEDDEDEDEAPKAKRRPRDPVPPQPEAPSVEVEALVDRILAELARRLANV